MARTSTKIVTSLPKSETGHGVLCRTASGQEYIISYNPEKEKFTLWKKCSEGLEKVSIANSPSDFDNVIPWES